MMNKPMPLYPGARVALLSASEPIEEAVLTAAVDSVRIMGLQPVVFPSCSHIHGYLAGSDFARAEDLQRAFADDSIDGILCMQGGYGAQRIVDRLDWESIADHPKFFGGHGDVTALHIQLNQKCHMATWHIPMPATEWCKEVDIFTLASLRRALFSGAPGPVYNPEEMVLRCVAKGTARGQLTGGNLAAVVSTLGTPWEIDTRHKILFLEESETEPCRVDRMLLQLKQAGKLTDCAGVLLGRFAPCEQQSQTYISPEDMFKELLLDECKPVIAGLACGQGMPTLSLPLGLNILMDATSTTLTILE